MLTFPGTEQTRANFELGHVLRNGEFESGDGTSQTVRQPIIACSWRQVAQVEI